MQYGQIVFILFIAFLLYYAVLIVMDIQKAKARSWRNRTIIPRKR